MIKWHTQFENFSNKLLLGIVVHHPGMVFSILMP